MRLALYFCVMCVQVTLVHAEQISSDRITTEQVILNVLDRNPQLKIDHFDSQALATRIRQARQTKPYEVKLEMENFLGSGNYKGTDQLGTTVSLVKIIEPNNRIEARSEVAQLQSSLLQNQQGSFRINLLAEAIQQLIHVASDQYRLEIVKDQLALTKRTYEIVSRRVAAGKSHAAEKRRVEIAQVRAEIELEHAEHEFLTSRVKLAAYWGQTSPTFSKAHVDLLKLSEITPFQQLEHQLQNNPDLVRLVSEENIAKAKIRLAKSKRSSDWEFSGGLRYFNESDDTALTMSLSIPLGTNSRAQAEVDEMEFLATREPLRYQQHWLKLYNHLFETYQELLHTQTAFNALGQKIIPAARQVAKDYELGYKNGRFSLLELNEAQEALLEARLEQVLTAARFHQLNIEIERLTGLSIQK